MSLSIGRSETEKDPWFSSVIVVLLWTCWLAFFSASTAFESFRMPMTGIVLLWAARYWSWVWAGLAFIIMAWIYHQWSQIPPGLFALSCFATFLALRLFISQVEIQSLASYSIGLALSFLMLEILQWSFLGRVLPEVSFSWSVMFWMLVSVVAQFTLGLVFYGSLRTTSA